MSAQAHTTWPLCPRCGENELFSSVTPPDPAKIRGCYACGWKPGANDPGKLESSRPVARPAAEDVLGPRP